MKGYHIFDLEVKTMEVSLIVSQRLTTFERLGSESPNFHERFK